MMRKQTRLLYVMVARAMAAELQRQTGVPDIKGVIRAAFAVIVLDIEARAAQYLREARWALLVGLVFLVAGASTYYAFDWRVGSPTFELFRGFTYISFGWSAISYGQRRALRYLINRLSVPGDEIKRSNVPDTETR